MAIKGKRRTRGGRAVAAAPRPHLIVPKKPFFRRRGVRVALLLLLLAVVGGVAWATIAVRSRNARTDLARQETAKFGTFVENAIQTGGLGQSFSTSYVILPELGQAIADFQAGTLKEGQLAKDAKVWAERATAAGESIGELRPELASLKEARNHIGRGLLLYAGVARLASIAAEAQDDLQKELFSLIEEQLPLAAQAFDSGWAKLNNQRGAVDLLQPSGFPTGAPQG